MVSTSVLVTKLHIPRSRAIVVHRSRLIERLNKGLDRRLTLISAPAGYGKTTLLSQWIASSDRRAAWISLSEDDGDFTRFLTYLVAALQTVSTQVGEETMRLLQAQPVPQPESLLTMLLNDIARIPSHFVLVLDDYDALDSTEIDTVVSFLLAHLPPQMHLVIATREDPQLPLARLRARAQMNELRIADLRFSCEEAAGFLRHTMGLNLSAEDIAALESRTEGWIAGLQMAALSMQGRTDTAAFIKAFTGSHRFVLDYLVEEVLQRQPENVQTFLLHTSILDRMCGALCDAVTLAPSTHGQPMIEEIERSNLLIVPLDDERYWFRYHGLFSDVLRAHLMTKQPEQVPSLHQRASQWYGVNGLIDEAVHHALAAENHRQAAVWVERAWPDMDRSFQTATWLGWAGKLPNELVRSMPVLSANFAWALLEHGRLEAAEVHLRNAERWLNRSPSARAEDEEYATAMFVGDEHQFQSLPATIAAARAYQAQAQGNITSTVRYGRQALDLLSEEDHLHRGVVGALLGVALWTQGDLETAHRTLAEGMANMQIAGNFLFGIRGTYILADIRMAQGRLREAISIYEQSLQLAEEQGEEVLRGTADLHLHLSELYREQDNLGIATEQLERSEALGEQSASPHWQYRLCLARARIHEVHGNLVGALEQLDEAERRYVRTPVPNMRPVAALKTRVWLAQGRLPEALRWVQERGLSIDDDLSYLSEFEHVTFSRVLIAQYRQARTECAIHEAVGLLERLLKAAEAAGRMGSAIKILVLQALAYEAQGEIQRALGPLERALMLAEPEGYVRMFVDEGLPMAGLLSEALARGIQPEYVSKLLVASDTEKRERSDSISPPSAQLLIEPLSPRELEVLQLIAQGCSNQEIAERLVLALSTVKGHNRAIFGKLHVRRRTEAIARARELGLI